MKKNHFRTCMLFCIHLPFLLTLTYANTHKSMIAIIGAMDEEIALLESKIQDKKTQTIANTLFIEGTLENKEVVLLKSGVGKVNAAMSTTILHQEYSPRLVINIGSAGGVTKQLKIGDVVISDETVHHDADAKAIGFEIGQLPGMPKSYASDRFLVKLASSILPNMNLNYKIGLIGSGDSFIADKKRTNEIKKNFPNILAVEMEAAAIAQVCYQYNTPFIVVRSLSDIPDNESPLTFSEYLKVASQNSANMVLQMLQAL